MTESRKHILDDNASRRSGALPVQRLPDGEVAFKIPKQDYKMLTRMFPDLISTDNTTRLAAWHKLRRSPIGAKYLVVRTPAQVRRSQKGIIIK